MSITHEELKRRQREERANHPEGLVLRVHRALSWLDRAEQCEDDDGKFVFLWVAFNAAYASESPESERPDERRAYGEFLEKLVGLDADKVLYELIWKEFSGSVRRILSSQFLFEPFWEYTRGRRTEEKWKVAFSKANSAATDALGKRQTVKVFSIVLSRMYTLRNQMIHGGATWKSGVNREQLGTCKNFLEELVPNIIKLMLDNPNADWEDAVYPVVGE